MASLEIVNSKPHPGVRRFVRQQIPSEILEDSNLKEAMSVLPANYNFEIHKTIWRIKQANAKCVALQFPEGLLMYACTIADILESFAAVEHCLVLGDVTYGACCVDDFSASALGADFLVHYGHSCLVPVDYTSVPCLYVFVEIAIDVQHLVAAVKHNFVKQTKLVLAGTIQFTGAVQTAKSNLSDDFPSLKIPRIKPLSPGEVLGCTAPTLSPEDSDAIIFVADGRFHLEAIMIANPKIPAYRYDPYSRTLTREVYDHSGMRAARRKAIEDSRRHDHWGIVFGTLGHQGNPKVLDHVQQRLAEKGIQSTVYLMSELSPAKISLLSKSIGAWVQIACPRLSIDWGEGFSVPLLNPFEAEVALGYYKPWWDSETVCIGSNDGGLSNSHSSGECGQGNACNDCNCKDENSGKECKQPGADDGVYAMDYYSKDGGPWNSSYSVQRDFGKGLVQNKNKESIPITR